MNQPLIEGRHNDPAKRFADMAQRITDNAHHSSGGAVVIAPPAGGDPIEILMLDPHADLAMFWSTIMSKIQIQLGQAEAEKRRQSGFGQGR